MWNYENSSPLLSEFKTMLAIFTYRYVYYKNNKGNLLYKFAKFVKIIEEYYFFYLLL